MAKTEKVVFLGTGRRKSSIARALIEKYGNPNFNVDRTKVRNNVWTKLAKALNIFQKKH